MFEHETGLPLVHVNNIKAANTHTNGKSLSVCISYTCTHTHIHTSARAHAHTLTHSLTHAQTDSHQLSVYMVGDMLDAEVESFFSDAKMAHAVLTKGLTKPKTLFTRGFKRPNPTRDKPQTQTPKPKTRATNRQPRRLIAHPTL